MFTAIQCSKKGLCIANGERQIIIPLEIQQDKIACDIGDPHMG